ncbi:hypothetical protein BDN70DRAFT_821711, partial [Pholiota conissans]
MESRLCTVSSEPYTTPSTWEQGPNNPEPEEDDIQVEYHSASQKPARHFTIDDYLDSLIPPAKKSASESESGFQPWDPFSSRLDYEIA